jgi:hypothetical protein
MEVDHDLVEADPDVVEPGREMALSGLDLYDGVLTCFLVVM